MAKILVTGGAGNLGSALAEKLAARPDDHIVVADNLSTGVRSKVPERENVSFIRTDVNDYGDISALMVRFGFDYVFHFAAVVGVARTLAAPLTVLHDIRGIENVLSLSKNTGVQRFYFSSSSEVYGEPFELPQHEHTTPLNSKLPYAIVKNVGEAYVRTFQQEYGLGYTIFRFFNTYGPKQSDDFVVPRFVRQAMRNEEISIYGDGSQTRTFCYVDDNIDTCCAAHYTGQHVNDTINIGSHVQFTVLELAERVIAVTGSSSKIVHLPALKEGDMTRRCPDNTKMLDLLGRELLPVDAGIERLVAHYKAHGMPGEIS